MTQTVSIAGANTKTPPPLLTQLDKTLLSSQQCQARFPTSNVNFATNAMICAASEYSCCPAACCPLHTMTHGMAMLALAQPAAWLCAAHRSTG